jgi:hypothetical protein
MNKILNFTLLITLAIGLSACATQVMPDGGPRDTSPPEILSMSPENASTNLKSGKIKIEFEEYVILDKLNSQLLISPLMPENPKITVKGKSIVIQLPDSLLENTTYSIFFGDAIKNYKENIPAKNVRYVFSTGDKIDSLFVDGRLLNAIDNTPVENAYVMLYTSDYDSIVSKELPSYISKTDNKGNFKINNIANKNYKVFALEDKNSNYLFDQITEKVAFEKELIKVEKTIISEKIDTVSGDTIVKTALRYPKLNLMMFEHKPSRQLVMSSKVLSAAHVQITLKRKSNNIEFKSLYPKNINPVYRKKRDFSDTVDLWYDMSRLDSLVLQVSDNKTIIDTLTFEFKTEAKKGEFNYTTNFKSVLDYYKTMQIELQHPVKSFAKENFILQKLIDSNFVDVEIKSIEKSEAGSNIIYINADLEESAKYKFELKDSSIYNIYGQRNDSISIEFKTNKSANFGILNMEIKYEGDIPLLIELVDNKNNTVESYIIESSKTHKISNLKAGKYILRAVYDKNKNGRWDTGDYYKNIQPEDIETFSKPIEIKANWEIEEVWEIK